MTHNLIRTLTLSLLTLSAPLAYAQKSAQAQLSVQMRDIKDKDQEMLRKELPSLFSNPTYQLLDESIRVLMEKGAYENVFVQKGDNGNFIISGKPVRSIDAITFTGVHKGTESELKALSDLKIGERFDRKKAVAAGEKMKNYYGELGYFNTIIEINFHKTESGNMRLAFDIQEKQPCRIESIEITTANIDLKEKLERRLGRLVHRPLTATRTRRLMSGVTDFLIDERYLSAEVIGPDAEYNADKTKAFVRIEIREPYRWEFYYSGYKFGFQASLYRAMDLRNKERKNLDPANEGAERLRRYYLDNGLPLVQIETKVVNPPNTYLKRVHYKINEGPRVRIEKIEIQGRASRPSVYYERFILYNSSQLVKSGYYNRVDLDNGFKNLVTHLRNEGFLRARILSSRTEYSEDKKHATIFLTIEEGPQTQIRALEFQGNKFFSSFELAKVTGLETNSALNLEDFEASIPKLVEFYRRTGFLEMRLLNSQSDLIEYNEQGTQARINYRIFEGPRVRIAAIAVEGNTFTKTNVILKESDFKIGEVLTPAKIDDATLRLNKLGLFSRSNISTVEEGTNVAERTLVISVTERDPGQFSLGAGVTNERNLTLRGYSGLAYNNLGGTARAISGRGEISENLAEIHYPEYEVTAGYMEPFIFNTRTRGRVNFTRKEYVFKYGAIESAQNPGTEAIMTQVTASNKVDFLAERDLTGHTKLTWKVWGVESQTDWEIHSRCFMESGDKEGLWNEDEGKCRPKTLQIGTIGPTLDVDYRDNPFLPTRGSFFRTAVDYAHPSLASSRGVNFWRVDSNYTKYTRLGSAKLVWANSVRGGYVANLANEADSGVPTSYAFLLGGIYTVRGFDVSGTGNERIPKQGDHGFNVERSTRKLIHTDSHYALVKSELRFPITGEHGGVLFYDGGMVKVSGFDFGRPYRDAVGFGYRYNTPVGPVALDLAFKINPKRYPGPVPDEEPFRFYFSIGTF